jgi:phosphotransferase system  glucose/maltose/N-acetylglucosamine-specific IIC component
MENFVVKCCIAAAFATMRAAGYKSEAFQAAAHLFVGGLIAAAFVQFFAIETESQYYRFWTPARQNITIAVVLSIIELACFFLIKGP